MAAASDEPVARITRLETTVYGDPSGKGEGLVDITARHQRQIYGEPAEGVKGILPRLVALEALFAEWERKLNSAVAALVKRVDELSDGKKTLLTLLGLGITSLSSVGALITALATAYALLARP